MVPAKARRWPAGTLSRWPVESRTSVPVGRVLSMTSLWFSDPYEQRGMGTPSRLVRNVMSAPTARPHTPAAPGISAVGEGSPGASVAAAAVAFPVDAAGVVWADTTGAGFPGGFPTAVEPEPPVHAATQASSGARSQRLLVVMLIGRRTARPGSLCIVRVTRATKTSCNRSFVVRSRPALPLDRLQAAFERAAPVRCCSATGIRNVRLVMGRGRTFAVRGGHAAPAGLGPGESVRQRPLRRPASGSASGVRADRQRV